MSNPERLFRDGEGAALERVARLEDENRRLRAEVERLAAGRDTPPRHRGVPPPALPGRFFLLAVALPLGMISLLLAVGPRHHSRSYVPPRYAEAITPRSFHATPYAHGRPVLEVTPVSSASTTCAPPYVVDGHGYRHYKLECMH